MALLSLITLCGCGRRGDDPHETAAQTPSEAEALFEQARALVLAENVCAADRSAACALLARAAEQGHDGAKDLLWVVGSITAPAIGDDCDYEGDDDEM